MMNTIGWRLALVAAACAFAPAAQAQRAEVIHWWTSGGESAAIKEFATAYNKAGGNWVDKAVAGGEAARASALSRIAGGNPPVAAQFNASKQYFDVIDEGLLNNIDAVAVKEGWDKMLPGPVLKVVKVKGHFYAAPVNIHNPTWFWYSKAALQKAGVAAEPKNIDEFFTALDKLKAAGLVPLALGGQGWQENITFYSMLLHVGGKDLYTKFYEGRDAATIDSPAFRKVLSDFKRLKAYTDPGSPNRNWNDAAAMVISGKAGFQIMGDWAKGEFVAANQTAGKEFGCFAGFGPNAPYMIAGDVFVFPKTSDAAAIAAQLKLATVMTSPSAQVAFNNKKGSIPIRTDVDLAAMDICAQAGVMAMKNPARHVANPDALVSPDVAGAVQDIVSKFWNTNQSVDETVKALQNAVKG
jgi:glucose/mannose transport system substrate-binding protein